MAREGQVEGESRGKGRKEKKGNQKEGGKGKEGRTTLRSSESRLSKVHQTRPHPHDVPVKRKSKRQSTVLLFTRFLSQIFIEQLFCHWLL